ncbi:hypothetical protein OFO12_03125 [Campylobacter sp. JMF_04 NA10]|nr:hypothetical protein [Campylobacter sp. JMF_04 NA10]MDA3076360.1 hypothetical protein [Campylobacter sp. JMF_04 NA10]
MKLYPSTEFTPCGFSRTELGGKESSEPAKILRELCQNSYDAFEKALGGA